MQVIYKKMGLSFRLVVSHPVCGVSRIEIIDLFTIWKHEMIRESSRLIAWGKLKTSFQ